MTTNEYTYSQLSELKQKKIVSITDNYKKKCNNEGKKETFAYEVASINIDDKLQTISNKVTIDLLNNKVIYDIKKNKV